MTLILVFDTETTGLPLFREPSDHPGQPHILELACGLYTPDGEEVEHYCSLVRPHGWEVPEEITKITGITPEQAHADGLPEWEVLAELERMWARAALRVAHNEQFDARIVRIAMKRFRKGAEEAWAAGAAACTARMASPVCALPPTPKMAAKGMRGPKTPNLEEAVRHLLDRPLTGGHRASGDMRDCAAVYFALLRQQAAAPIAAATRAVTREPITDLVAKHPDAPKPAPATAPITTTIRETDEGGFL